MQAQDFRHILEITELITNFALRWLIAIVIFLFYHETIVLYFDF